MFTYSIYWSALFVFVSCILVIHHVDRTVRLQDAAWSTTFTVSLARVNNNIPGLSNVHYDIAIRGWGRPGDSGNLKPYKDYPPPVDLIGKKATLRFSTNVSEYIPLLVNNFLLCYGFCMNTHFLYEYVYLFYILICFTCFCQLYSGFNKRLFF